MTRPTKIELELLAPAKNLEIGKIAIAHGADAVYIGPSDFGARVAVGNPLQDIAELVRYAQVYAAKVYATINTLLLEEEVEQAYRLAWNLYDAGVDALIIQDMALCDLKRMPPIQIHASTQTHNYSLERIQFLQSVGFDRVILARECSLDEIVHIRENTSIPLEAFVHGALCVSFSGQCYMSAAMCGRSANRGICAQTCRYAYDLVNAEKKAVLKNKHLLSLKDNRQIENLAGLIEAGVTSFKIEGRLKDADYVKNVVSAYRQELDHFIATHAEYKSVATGSIEHRFQPQLVSSFNRDYTEYFALGRKKSMISPLTPKSLGEYCGVVKEVLSSTRISIQGDDLQRIAFSNGDGLIFLSNEQFIGGNRLNSMVDQTLILNDPIDLQPGDRVYRNFNHQFQRRLQAEDTAIRQIPVTLIVTEKYDSEIVIALKDEQGNCSELLLSQDQRGDIPQKPDFALNRFMQAFSKLGDSPFVLTHSQIPAGVIRLTPLSTLNAWRRTLVNKLLEIRCEKTQQLKKNQALALAKSRKAFTAPEKRHYSFISGDFRDNVANSKALEFYQKHTDQVVGKAFETAVRQNADIPAMTCKYCLKFELGFCPRFAREHSFTGQPMPVVDQSEWKEPMYLRSNAHLLRLSFNCKACQMEIFLEK